MVGLAIIAVQQGLLSTVAVVPIIIGSNLGTTSTALIASLGMGLVAKRAALSNLIFNTVGLLIFLPFMGSFALFVVDLVGEGDVAVATAHLLFNVGVAIAGAAILPLVVRWLEPDIKRPPN
jgi:Na+/phosphate symporter